MKVTLKTRDQLLDEGCTAGKLSARYGHYGIYLGTKKECTVVCSWYQEKNLGKTGRLVRVQMDGAEPKVLVQVGNHTSWYPWFVLADYDLRSYKDQTKKKQIAGGRAEYNPVTGFHFSCGLSEMTKSDARRLAKWILSL